MSFDPISAIMNTAGLVIDRLVPDKAAAAKLKTEIAAEVQLAEIDLAKSRMAVAAEDAKSGRGGFRDQAGKLAVYSCGYAWLGEPLLTWVLSAVAPSVPPPPPVDPALAYSMLAGMLGLAGVRAHDLKHGTRK